MHDYLKGLAGEVRSHLETVNRPGLAALHQHLDSGKSIAFLGADASAPLYPRRQELIAELLNNATGLVAEQTIKSWGQLATSNPNAVFDEVRRHLGEHDYEAVLRRSFRPYRDPLSKRTWSPVHELVVRCNFAGVITTGYDSGIVDARMAIRSRASSTGFASWTDENALDRWRTGDIFTDDELPVLFAHGHHNQPATMVLATREFRLAYSGKLGRTLARHIDGSHLVWIGFGFGFDRITSIIETIAEGKGSQTHPGGAPRHVAIMPWDPGHGDADLMDPMTRRRIVETAYGCRVVLYPAREDDHSALTRLLEPFTDRRFPALDGSPGTQLAVTARVSDRPRPPIERTIRWVHGGVPVDHFAGRADELGKLARWSADPNVLLVGITAWGGAGKTALVTEFIERQDAVSSRPFRGVFGWSFYEDGSAERWAVTLLAWVNAVYDFRPPKGELAVQVLGVLRYLPLLVVLDGLEVAQEGPAGQSHGRLLDGILRVVLTSACRIEHASLVMLTSRFPFADLEHFDGAAARMLDVPPLTDKEGAELLGNAGADWLTVPQRIELVQAVDGHALALSTLAAALRERLPLSDLDQFLEELKSAPRTESRVARVLAFYAERLSLADRMTVAIVALFQRPIPTKTVLSLGLQSSLRRPLNGWTAEDVETAARQRLAGLLNWHPEGAVSCHPLVREAFRPMILTGRAAVLARDIALGNLPHGPVSSKEEALLIVEMIELLLDAEQWQAALELYRSRTRSGRVWRWLPAARLGQRCAMSFVRTRLRGDWLSVNEMGYFSNDAGLCAMHSGDVTGAEPLLRQAAKHFSSIRAFAAHAISMRNLVACLLLKGDPSGARESALAAVEAAEFAAQPPGQRSAHVCLAAALDLNGKTWAAALEFAAASNIPDPSVNQLLYSNEGVRWADFLMRIGRITEAKSVGESNLAICQERQWHADIARCDRQLARLDLTVGEFGPALERLSRAAKVFRAGDYLAELSLTMADLAEAWRLAGDPAQAEQLCTDSIVTLDSPRELLPSLARNLAARSRARADLFTKSADRLTLERARDDADHCLRLATRLRRLPWLELAALEAHAHADLAETVDHGWSGKAEYQRAGLMPSDT